MSSDKHDEYQIAEIPVDINLQEIIDDVGVRIKRLLIEEDFMSSTTTEDIKYLDWAINYHWTPAEKESICASMCKAKLTQVFQRNWNKYSTENFCDPDYETDVLYENLNGILDVIANSTSTCTDLCEDIYKNLVHKDILRYLELPQLRPATFANDNSENDRCETIVLNLLIVLHNVLHNVSECRESLRGSGAVELLQRFRDSDGDTIEILALLVQAYIVTEDENDIINSDEETFRALVNALQDCLESPEDNDSGFRTDELLAAINLLAVNDSNKYRVVNTGALPHYVEVLQGDVVKEQRLAAEGLWTLAFKCKDDIIKEPGCVEALTKLSESSKDPEVKKQVDGVLWIIRGNDQDPIMGEVAKDKAGQHVFISYQWDSKSTVLQLRDKLRASGFKVCVDVDNMSGSVLESMAAAVENAAVVLICLTNKYKESPNCRTEAEYTFRLQKSVVPLRLEDRYNPNGWLGALIGSQLVHDFTKEIEFVFPDLVRDLNNRGRWVAENGSGPQNQDGSNNQGQESKGQASKDQSSALEKWTKSNIREWLNRNKLNHRKDWFAEFDGKHLKEFQIMRRDSPELFHLLLRDNNFSMIDILNLNIALKEL